MEEDAAESYRQAVGAKGLDRSGEQAAVIRGLNSTIPGNRSIGGTKYVIWQRSGAWRAWVTAVLF